MDLDYGLVLNLPLNEGSGTKVYDKSPSQYHGTIINTTWVTGKLGSKALYFSGVDDVDYVNLGDVLDVGLNDISFAFWCNLSDMNNGYRALMGKKGGTWSGVGAGYEIVFTQEGWLGRLQLGMADGATFEYINSLTDFRDSGWKYVVFTLDRDGNGKCYVNGVLEVTRDISGCAGDISNALTLRVGCRGTGGYNIKGTLDEIRIYNRVLSAEEIRALYAQGQFDLDYGLVLHLPLNEGSGTKAYDQSPNKNHGTLVNSPTWVDGRLGSKVINLDGINQYIRCYDDSSFDVSSFTLTAWIYPSGNTGLYRMIFNRRGAGDPVFYFAIDNGEKLRIVVYVPDYTGYASATSISQNIWQFVTVTYNGSNGGIKIYINGKSDIQATVGTSLNTSISDICLGIEGDGSAYPFVGKISNARMYNRILSVEEIQALYQWGRYWDDI